MLDSMHRARTGRHLGLTLYAQLGTCPDDSDVFLALFNTRELARTAENALNGLTVVSPPWLAIGRLIYPVTNPVLAGEFIGVATSDEVAERITEAVSRGWTVGHG
jgi:hypothetical protein